MTVSGTQQKFGKYLLQQRLGVGGMAEVWLALQAGPGGFSKQVVIKRILPELAGDPQFVDMFLQEARLVAHLNHPNLIQIFDFGEIDGTYYLVMEYIEGRSLRFLAQQPGAHPLEFGFVAAVISAACSGLQQAHDLRGPAGERLSLVHRDIAPDNLLVSYDGITKVIDFGIAKALEGDLRTQSGVVKGKFGYMSPEQVRGWPIDRRSDVYSLGVVIYELLAGRRPFVGTQTEVLDGILSQAPTPLEAIRPDLPAPVTDLVRAALAKAPAERPESARAMELVLMEVARAEGFGTSEVGRLVRQLSAQDEPTLPWRPPPSELPSPGAPAEPISGAGTTRSTRAPELDPASDVEPEPLPGAGSIDLSGRVELAAKPSELAGGEPRPVPRSNRFEPPAEPELTLMESPPPPPELPPAPEPQRPRRRPWIWIGLGLCLAAALTVWRVLPLLRAPPVAALRLEVDSEPLGAEIWIDGLPTGQHTPATLDWDGEIAHQVTLKHEGFAQTSQQVPAGQPSGALAIALLPLAHLEVRSEPAGAEISSDSESFGPAPRTIELVAGTSQKFKASLPGYLDAVTSVTVAAGATFVWAPVLRPAGTLHIDSDPRGAQVRVDGEAIGKTPLEVAVAAGPAHAVQIDGETLESFRATINVGAGGTKIVSAHLADREEHRLQATLASVERQLETAETQLRFTTSHHSMIYATEMAAVKRQSVLEDRVDRLTRQRDELQGQIESHRTELEDRLRPP